VPCATPTWTETSISPSRGCTTGVSAEEIAQLVKTVKETGLSYVLGETSYYDPSAISCRKRVARGAFCS
jgi:hypothetical protein